MNYTAEEIEKALRTFIKSGSANGREDMRGYLLRRVKSMAKVVTHAI